MKPQFTLFQKIMTAIFIAMQTAVMISDGVRLSADDGSDAGTYYYAVNLVLCIGLLAVFLVLIFNPKICVSTDETDDEQQLSALVSASRTYMCFIAVDIALIFAFVMFISKQVKHPALWIVVGGIVIFVAGAVKYIYDSQKFAVIEPADAEAEEETEEKSEESDINDEKTEQTEQTAGEEAETKVSEEAPAEEETEEAEKDVPDAGAAEEEIEENTSDDEEPQEQADNENEEDE